jgi:hydroxyacylglutathione hydrolase
MAFLNGYTVIRNVDKSVFTGDTIFIGGCGRFFEGDAKGMVYAMQVATQNMP